MNPVKVIIVAAGSGSRFGASLPKQFCNLCGRPVLMMTIDAFRRVLPAAEIIVVVSASMESFWRELCTEYGYESPMVVIGGASRGESVKNALASIETADEALVLVHDGARPLVDESTIARVLEKLSESDIDGVIPAVAVTDSLRQIMDGDGVSKAVDRSRFRAVQTPQGFRFGRLRHAYSIPLDSSVTDDASAMERAGFKAIALVEGNPANIKITHPFDIVLAEAIIGSGK